jgi:putative transposase
MPNKPAQQMTSSERAAFLEEAKTNGVLETCRTHGITSATYYAWLERYQHGGIEALARNEKKSDDRAELIALRRENDRLKRLLAEKEIALDIKDALLKKTSQRLNSAQLSPKPL